MAAPADNVQMATTGAANEGTGTAAQGQVQTVVVVQQVQAAPQKPPAPTRYAYGYYAIAIGIWHAFMTWVWSIFTYLEDGWGTLFMFCGFLPSLGTIIWMVMDATTKCCGKGTDEVTICGCNCANAKWVMAVPMAVFAFLRLILYGVLFGHAADWLLDAEVNGSDSLDEIAWIVIFFAAWDDGPIITLAIDYWFIYGKKDDNGVMGTHRNPLRCVIAQAAVMFVSMWSILAVTLDFLEPGDVWAPLMHGIISSAVLLYGIFCNFTGAVEGKYVNNSMTRTIWLILAAAGGVGVIVVVIWIISDAGSMGVLGYVFLYWYSAYSIPGVFAACQFKLKDSQSELFLAF